MIIFILARIIVPARNSDDRTSDVIVDVLARDSIAIDTTSSPQLPERSRFPALCTVIANDFLFGAMRQSVVLSGECDDDFMIVGERAADDTASGALMRVEQEVKDENEEHGIYEDGGLPVGVG
jgi:hypothetical protein